MINSLKNIRLDPLTKLLQEEQIKQEMEKYLFDDKKYEGDTVFLIQLQCWEELNQTFGQKTGDIILTQFAFLLTKIFRKTDLIARVGARSFFIYRLGHQDDDQINKISHKLLEQLDISNMLHDKVADSGLYIGICHTQGADSYWQLLDKAKSALSQAIVQKQLYYIFQGQESQAASSILLPIPEYKPDYEDLDLKFVAGMTNFLFSCNNVKLSIEIVLARICDYFHVQGAYILEKSINGKYYMISYEWEHQEKPVEHNNLKVLPAWIGDSYQEAFDNQYMIVCNRLTELSRYNRFMAQRQKIRGTKALMQSAILEYGKYIGYVSLVDLEKERVWKSSEIMTFSLVSKIIAANLLQVRSAQLSSHLTYNDILTNSWNLARFLQIGTQRLKFVKKKKAVIVFDIKNFKIVNIEYSYKEGDDILIAIGNVLRHFIEEDECFARVEADNFVMLLYYDSLQNLKQRIELFMQRLERIPQNKNIRFQIMCMTGIYLVESEPQELSTMIDYANSAKKLIKEYHKSTYAFYNDKIEKQNQRERQLASIMKSSLDAKEFVVYYQPKIYIPTRTCIGIEALVRWNTQDGTLIQPDEFVPLFERNGFISEVDRYVMKKACKQIQKWMKEKKPLLPIAVNISRVHLQEPDFIEQVTSICRQYQVSPHMIELEITESAFLEDSEIVLERAGQLKDAGFALSMDDFGTGYSSLSLLKDLPMDIMKLDKEFFHKTANNREKIVISNVIHMAKELKIQVISEGIETTEQVKFLQEIGCDLAQGYYYSRPVPMEALEKYLYLPFGEEKK